MYVYRSVYIKKTQPLPGVNDTEKSREIVSDSNSESTDSRGAPLRVIMKLNKKRATPLFKREIAQESRFHFCCEELPRIPRFQY